MESVTDEPDVTQALELVSDIRMTRAPERVIDEAREAARALKNILASKDNKFMLHGKQYLQFEDWQTLGRFYGVTAKIKHTSQVSYGESTGFEASAEAVRADGMVISAADAMCMDDEANWKGKPIFQLRSMAQTRACAKALRNVLSWVAVLAGYSPTPAEEMTGDESPYSKPQAQADDVPSCPECGGQMWDNRATKKGKQPDFKCKDKACNKAVWLDGAAKSEATQLRQAAVDVCKLLNEAGDEPQWTAKTLNEYSLREYGKAADSLELQPLRELVKKLSLRLDELKKPKTDPADKEKREEMIDKIVAEFKEEDIDRQVAETYGKDAVLEHLSLVQLETLYGELIPF